MVLNDWRLMFRLIVFFFCFLQVLRLLGLAAAVVEVDGMAVGLAGTRRRLRLVFLALLLY